MKDSKKQKKSKNTENNNIIKIDTVIQPDLFSLSERANVISVENELAIQKNAIIESAVRANSAIDCGSSGVTLGKCVSDSLIVASSLGDMTAIRPNYLQEPAYEIKPSPLRLHDLELTKIHEPISEHEKRIRDLENANKQKDEKIEDLESKYSNLENKYDNLKGRDKRRKRQIKDFSDEFHQGMNKNMPIVNHVSKYLKLLEKELDYDEEE